MPEAFDAIVIGAGEAGAVVASRAVAAGHRVAMIYREPYGSTCVNTGCVPSKFLIHRANVAHTVRTSARFHVNGHGEPGVDLVPGRLPHGSSIGRGRCRTGTFPRAIVPHRDDVQDHPSASMRSSGTSARCRSSSGSSMRGCRSRNAR